ncbi:hypothetical protein FGL68_22465 [Acinetobacter baumannii]|nr:hypothetical protein [Acinetobacter baumannii]
MDVYKNGVRAVPRRDIAAEDAARKPSKVTVRQMTAEERERMEKIGPYRDYFGKKSKTLIAGWETK